MADTLTILGIESSCDDTAAAVVRGEPGGAAQILSSVVYGQTDLHAQFGGVVPEIAARAHAEKIDTCVMAALEEAGSGLHDIVRTRVILTDIDNWKQAIEARKIYCQEARPVDTIMAIERFVNPEWLVEIEVDAVVAD